MYQSGMDFNCPISKRPIKPLTPLNRLNAIFVLAVDRIAKSPYHFNWSMSSAIGLYCALPWVVLGAHYKNNIGNGAGDNPNPNPNPT
jgi:energy-coupling factor transporter transmembrane protein EcfT